MACRKLEMVATQIYADCLIGFILIMQMDILQNNVLRGF
jgi:hypothetical protein